MATATTDVRPPKRPASARRRARGSWRAWSDLSARDLVRVPGLLSLSRLPLAAAFPLTLGRPGWGIGVLVAAGVTDLLDGWYARRFHEETRTGAALDGITDKVFVLVVVGSLAAYGSMTVLEVLLLATRELGEAALAIRLAVDPGRRGARVRSANLPGKLATTLQYAAIVAILLELERRSLLVGATALAGLVATASYWSRDVRALRPPRRGR